MSPRQNTRRTRMRERSRKELLRVLGRSRSTANTVARKLTLQRQDGGVRLPPEPPPCPPGWRTGPPDFVGIGAQRGGTTRWFDLITSHPEVIPPGPEKELHYFDRFYDGGFTPADADAYHRHFPRDEGRKAGEWTPLYVAAPWIPPLLAASAPDARLLLLLRDPVERMISGLQHDIRLAHDLGLPLSQLAPVEAFARGMYHSQIVGLLEHFDRSQLLILQYERCSCKPAAEMRRTFEFIGVRDVDFLPELNRHPNHQPSKPVLDIAARTAYTRAYRQDVSKLISAFPEVDVSLWPNFSDLAG